MSKDRTSQCYAATYNIFYKTKFILAAGSQRLLTYQTNRFPISFKLIGSLFGESLEKVFLKGNSPNMILSKKYIYTKMEIKKKIITMGCGIMFLKKISYLQYKCHIKTPGTVGRIIIYFHFNERIAKT